MTLDQVAHYRAVRARIIAGYRPPVLLPGLPPGERKALPPQEPEPELPAARRARLLHGAPASASLHAAVYPTLDALGAAWFEVFTRKRTPLLARMRWRVFRDLQRLGLSLNRIGRLTGYDHTTIIYGLRKLAKEENDHADR